MKESKVTVATHLSNPSSCGETRARRPAMYRVVHIHRSTWRGQRERGTSCSGTFLARAGHVAALTSGLFIPTSRVRRGTRIAFPLGLLPISVGRPLIGNNRSRWLRGGRFARTNGHFLAGGEKGVWSGGMYDF